VHRAVGLHELIQRGGDRVAGAFLAHLVDGGTRGTGRWAVSTRASSAPGERERPAGAGRRWARLMSPRA
jgi:hypothetical protein